MLKTLIISLLLLGTIASAQDSSNFSKHRVFLEMMGHGGFGSVNYEKNLLKIENEKSHWTFRTGLSVLPGDKNSGYSLIFPNSINFLYGKTHMLEVGLGEVVTLNLKGNFFMRMMPVLGYRFMSKETPWFIRTTYTPFISHIWDIRMSHWGGLSIGYQFK